MSFILIIMSHVFAFGLIMGADQTKEASWRKNYIVSILVLLLLIDFLVTPMILIVVKVYRPQALSFLQPHLARIVAANEKVPPKP